MTTAYTSLLGLALPVTGELSGTWGDVVNNSITSLLDSAVAGTTNVSTDGDVTLTTTTGAANTARKAILLFSGARTALRTVTAPAQSKVYTVINATTGGYAVKLVGSGPTTERTPFSSTPRGQTARLPPPSLCPVWFRVSRRPSSARRSALRLRSSLALKTDTATRVRAQFRPTQRSSSLLTFLVCARSDGGRGAQ